MTSDRGTSGPWCPVCRQSVSETGMAWSFPRHGDSCAGSGRKVRDRDHGFVVNGRVLPEWETDASGDYSTSEQKR